MKLSFTTASLVLTGIPIVLLSGCVVGDPNPNGDEEWNPLQGAASLGDAAPSSEAADPAEPASSGGGGGGDGDASTEELNDALEDVNDALEDVEAGLFINIAADAMYVVTEPLQVTSYIPGSDWAVEYVSATCDAASDILLSGGCSAMTLRTVYDYNYTDDTQYEGSVMGTGSFPLVEGGKPTGWTCGQPLASSGTQNLGNGYTVTYSYSIIEPAEVFAVCLAVE